jgi:hypothetical protein
MAFGSAAWALGDAGRVDLAARAARVPRGAVELAAYVSSGPSITPGRTKRPSSRHSVSTTPAPRRRSRAARTAASSVSGVSRAASRTSLLMLQDRRSAPQGRCVQGRGLVFSLRDERNVVQQLTEGQRHTSQGLERRDVVGGDRLFGADDLPNIGRRELADVTDNVWRELRVISNDAISRLAKK